MLVAYHSISRYFFLTIVRKEMQPYIRSALVVFGLLLFQTTFLPFIALGGYLPDLFILYLVYIALRRGQIEATISGFIIGLLQDIITTQFFGLAALSKTIAGFIAGYFFNAGVAQNQLVAASLVLAARIGVAWFFQHALLPARHRRRFRRRRQQTFPLPNPI